METRHRGMLGGGPASQHPRSQSHQIRRPMPRPVMALSSRYPQLLCILTEFSAETAFIRAIAHRARVILNVARMCALFINLKPRCALACGGESPLSRADARC